MKYGFKLFLVLIAAFQLKSAAQEQAVIVRISQDTVIVGHSFKIEFEIQNIQGVFTPPDFYPFKVQAGPNTASSFSMINGKVTQKMTYTYWLAATDPGTFTLPPATIQSDKELYNTNEVAIVVMQGENKSDSSRKPDKSKEYKTDIGKSDEENVKPKRKIRKI